MPASLTARRSSQRRRYSLPGYCQGVWQGLMGPCFGNLVNRVLDPPSLKLQALKDIVSSRTKGVCSPRPPSSF